MRFSQSFKPPFFKLHNNSAVIWRADGINPGFGGQKLNLQAMRSLIGWKRRFLTVKSHIDAMGSSNTLRYSDYNATSDRNVFKCTKNWKIWTEKNDEIAQCYFWSHQGFDGQNCPIWIKNRKYYYCNLSRSFFWQFSVYVCNLRNCQHWNFIFVQNCQGVLCKNVHSDSSGKSVLI